MQCSFFSWIMQRSLIAHDPSAGSCVADAIPLTMHVDSRSIHMELECFRFIHMGFIDASRYVASYLLLLPLNDET